MKLSIVTISVALFLSFDSVDSHLQQPSSPRYNTAVDGEPSEGKNRAAGSLRGTTLEDTARTLTKLEQTAMHEQMRASLHVQLAEEKMRTYGGGVII